MATEVQANNVILALDQSTSRTGWAIFRNDKLVDYGVYKIDGYEEEKIELMRNWLDNKINEITLDPNVRLKIVLEDIQLQRNDVKTYKVLAHLQGVLINTFFRNKQKVVDGISIYYSSEWKSTCGIKGKDRTTQKQNAQKFIIDTYNIKVTQDTCDAICLGIHELKQKNDIINFE